MNKKDLVVLILEAGDKLRFNSNLRYGQALYNTLCTLDKDLAENINGTDDDCFYDDNKISNFLSRVAENWKK